MDNSAYSYGILCAWDWMNYYYATMWMNHKRKKKPDLKSNTFNFFKWGIFIKLKLERELSVVMAVGIMATPGFGRSGKKGRIGVDFWNPVLLFLGAEHIYVKIYYMH